MDALATPLRDCLFQYFFLLTGYVVGGTVTVHSQLRDSPAVILSGFHVLFLSMYVIFFTFFAGGFMLAHAFSWLFLTHLLHLDAGHPQLQHVLALTYRVGRTQCISRGCMSL